MIKEFSVKNFMSFNEEVTSSMEASTNSVSEYPGNVSNVCNNQLLKCLVFMDQMLVVKLIF